VKYLPRLAWNHDVPDVGLPKWLVIKDMNHQRLPSLLFFFCSYCLCVLGLYHFLRSKDQIL
jgi:lipid-A-disaccharide synthase-like uncharacterized protein